LIYRELVVMVHNPLSPPKPLKTSATRWFFYAFSGTKLASVNGKGIKTPTTEGGMVFRGFEAPPRHGITRPKGRVIPPFSV
jgi:hypothetical protein